MSTYRGKVQGFATRGKEQEGRISYEDGITKALTAFKEAQTSADPQTIILVEYTFISQELQFCEETDKDTLSSLTQAIQSFDDAFLALKVVENKIQYQGVENAIPHNGKYRVSGFPKDAFHIACIAHRTRLQNILRSPGIDPIEKALLKQRFANLSTAKTAILKSRKRRWQNKESHSLAPSSREASSRHTFSHDNRNDFF